MEEISIRYAVFTTSKISISYLFHQDLRHSIIFCGYQLFYNMLSYSTVFCDILSRDSKKACLFTFLCRLLVSENRFYHRWHVYWNSNRRLPFINCRPWIIFHFPFPFVANKHKFAISIFRWSEQTEVAISSIIQIWKRKPRRFIFFFTWSV